jgi:hypothetical protein
LAGKGYTEWQQAGRAFCLRETAHDALAKAAMTAWDARLTRVRRRAHDAALSGSGPVTTTLGNTNFRGLARLRLHDLSISRTDNEGQRSRKVEAIKVHHLIPGRDKVVDELLLSVGTSVDFSQGAELGV